MHDVIEMAKQPPPPPVQPPKRKGKATDPSSGVPKLKRTETLAIADVTAARVRAYAAPCDAW